MLLFGVCSIVNVRIFVVCILIWLSVCCRDLKPENILLDDEGKLITVEYLQNVLQLFFLNVDS